MDARRTVAFKARDNLKAERGAAVRAAQKAVDQLHAHEAERTPAITFKPRAIGPDDTA